MDSLEKTEESNENNANVAEEKNENNVINFIYLFISLIIQNDDWYDSVGQNKDDNKNINFDEMGGFDFNDDQQEDNNNENEMEKE